MKKLSIYMMLAFAGLFMAACGPEDNEFASPKQADADDAVLLPGFTAGQIGLIDLNTVEVSDAQDVQAFTITSDALPEGVVLSKAEILFKDDTILPATVDGKVSGVELSQYITSIYGKRPEARTEEGKVYLYATHNGGTVKIYAGKVTFQVVPKAPFISEGYYLIGDMNSWDGTKMLDYKFSHSSADVYEDPVFTVTFTTTADNQYWKIIPQSNVDANNVWNEGETGVVGVKVDGDTSSEGELTTTKPQAGKIEKAGLYQLTINMMDYTYTIKAVAPQFYMVGALPGWSAEGAAKALLYPSSTTTMSYTSKYTGAWDLKLWNKDDLGNWDNAYGCEVDGDNSESGNLINSNAQAISAPSAEFYTFTIDIVKMTYTWTKLANQNPTEYTKIGVIGEFNGWGSDMEMTQVTPHNWYVQGTVSDGGLKFRANGGWAVNWGTNLTVTGSDFYGTGTQDGSDITVPAGTYDFYLNDITGEFAIVAK